MNAGPYNAKRPRFPPSPQDAGRGSAPRVNLDPAFVHHQLNKQQPAGCSGQPNKVLLLTIINAIYPIDCQVLQKAIASMAQAVRIVIFRRNGVQAMVELENEEVASRVKEQLHGCDIYEGCCTVRVDFATPQKLNVYRNGNDSFDFTMPPDWQGNGPRLAGNNPNRPVLLGEQQRPQQQQMQPRPQQPRPRFNQPQPRQHFNQSGPRQQFNQAGPPQQPNQSYGSYNQYEWGDNGNGRPGRDYGGYEGYDNDASAFFGDQRSFGNPCIMVYGLHTEVFSTWRLFNLLCVFGNVERIKLLKSKPGCAMVEMGSHEEAQNVMSLLDGATCFGCQVSIGTCRQNKLLPPESGMGPFFAELSGNELNRFRNSNHRNRVVPPSPILHFFNAPPSINEYDIIELFAQATAYDTNISLSSPLRIGFVRQRENNSGSTPRSSSGFIEFRSASEAVEALSIVNHEPMNDKQGVGKRPYTFKLAFSSCNSIPGFVESRSDYGDNRPKKRPNEDNEDIKEEEHINSQF